MIVNIVYNISSDIIQHGQHVCINIYNARHVYYNLERGYGERLSGGGCLYSVCPLTKILNSKTIEQLIMSNNKIDLIYNN